MGNALLVEYELSGPQPQYCSTGTEISISRGFLLSIQIRFEEYTLDLHIVTGDGQVKKQAHCHPKRGSVSKVRGNGGKALALEESQEI